MSYCNWLVLFALVIPLWFGSATGNAYPLDGYPQTGIRRLEQARLSTVGEMTGERQPPGARLPTDAVDIRLRGSSATLPSTDRDFTERLVQALGAQAADYSLAVLDLTKPEAPAYAEYRGDYRQNVGSVGKLLAALGFFQALADTWPDDLSRRAQVLRTSVVTADEFAHHDHHTIRLFDVDSRTLVQRSLQDGDRGNLWEYLDWTLSVSSNSAAAMLMREAMLLRALGDDYPPSANTSLPFFTQRSSAELTALFQRTFWEPVERQGLSLQNLRQGSFFTQRGKQLVNGGGNSYATARSLMEFLLLMEQGLLVDDWSSTRLKRLLYMTERRIRYASAPALVDAAVYFKSGSLYGCKQEAGFHCGAYRGNVRNYMNSVAIVEQQIGELKLHYMVVVISNVLRENSALAHQALGTTIHQLIRSRHQLPGD